jgi:hypothetical protein
MATRQSFWKTCCLHLYGRLRMQQVLPKSWQTAMKLPAVITQTTAILMFRHQVSLKATALLLEVCIDENNFYVGIKWKQPILTDSNFGSAGPKLQLHSLKLSVIPQSRNLIVMPNFECQLYCVRFEVLTGVTVECRLLRYKTSVRTSQKTHISAIEASRLMLCKTWGFHGGDDEEYHLLGRYAVIL